MSKVLPILFNTDMVCAILDGRKTVTRRVIHTDISNQFDVEVDGSVICYIERATGDRWIPEKLCRYQPGDILYVRETWQVFQTYPSTYGFDVLYRAIQEIRPCIFTPERYEKFIKYEDGKNHPRWVSSQFMPKEAARIWLKVTDVRVERLQDVTEEQAYREGAIKAHDDCDNRDYWYYKEGQNYLNGNVWTENARQCFLWGIWNGTLKKANYEKYHSNANPWVWVIEFERCEKPEE